MKVARGLVEKFLGVVLLTFFLVLTGIIVLPSWGQTYGNESAVQAGADETGGGTPIVHNVWSTGTPIPTAVTYGAGAVVAGQIYVVGGNSAAGNTAAGVVADVQIYNPTTKVWSVGVSYPTTIEAASAAVVKGVLYVFGGSPDSQNPTNAVWAYNPTKKTWSSKAPMPTARWGTEAVVNGKTGIVYVIGGDINTSGNGNIDTVESYNPATNTWLGEAPMLVAKGQSAAALLGGTTIVVADGFTNGGGTTGDTEGYNLATNTWSTLASNPSGDRGAACSGGIGKLYDVGGANAPNVTESFTLTTDKWKNTLAPIPQAVFFPASAVYKGQLYCIGGWPSWLGTPQNNVQVYQP